MVTGIYAGDYAHWRGNEQNGAFSGANLPETWTKEGENLLWDAPFGSRSAPLIMNDHVYLINRAGSGETLQERIMALDLNTGKLAWEKRFNVFLTDIVSLRVGWANLSGDPETGYIYGHGVEGRFFCINGADGKVIWDRSLTEEFGRISGYGGRTNTPIVHGNNVIISSLTSGWGPHGKGLHRFWAMDKMTGEMKWWSEPSGKPLDTTYATPIIHDFNGTATLFTGLADGTIISMNPKTGIRNWQFTLSKRGINSSVVYRNGKVYATHSEENLDSPKMGRFVCLDAATGKELWRIDALPCGYTTPIVTDDLIYISDNSANLHCYNTADGSENWEFNYGKEGKGSPILADGKIYVGEVRGGYHILKVSKEKCERLSETKFFKEDGAPEEIFATPGTAHGKVILATIDHIYCISKEAADFRSKTVEVPAPPAKEVGETAHVQIEPAEGWVAPGESITFTLQGFDANGNPTGKQDATYSVAGLEGTVAADGSFAPGNTGFAAGMVTATAGELSSTARLRVIPEIPITEDFESYGVGAPPPGWISSKLKSQVIDHEGSKVLLKLADRPAPPFARLRCYMTPPIEAGYTVKTDLLGKSKRKRWMPDMGLINSRYLLILTGTTERERYLRLVSWAPIPRVQKQIEFDWKPDEWYSAKLSTELNGDTGIVRAKVWKRGEPEPAEWTLEMEDPAPNKAGSPGLYAFSTMITSKSKGTEVLFDNVEITPNK